ncbi:MAG: Tex family protein, partial [Chitinophagales bacterium]
MKNNLIKTIAQALNFKHHFVENTINLLDEDASVPFIARYRKDNTGGLNETQILSIKEMLEQIKELEKRKKYILKAIDDQGKLTPELKAKIENTQELIVLEDLYLPFKLKRKTRGTTARDKGLEGLAKMLMTQNGNDVQAMAKRFLNKDVKTTEDALQGARDIIAEWVNERLSAREKMRKLFKREAIITSKLSKKDKTEAAQKYRDYFEFSESSSKIKSHRLLAIFRGEKESFLKVKIEPNKAKAVDILKPMFVRDVNKASLEVEKALEDAYKRLLKPSLETELRKELKDKADKVAIDVFAENLKELLLAAPVGAKKTMGIDPGFRSGCKVVCLNEKGDFLKYESIFPHAPQVQKAKAEETLKALIQKYKIEVIAIGNGTAGRETERLVKNLNLDKSIQIYLVNEDGASIYSASEVAREEFPREDLTVRGAISIGRRLMDPLAELVKIDAKSIGVGQYQYDVNQKQLKNRLDAVVESCVNNVGVNINTASKYILTYISGLGETLAQNIIDYRKENKGISSRKELKKVARMGAKSYEQCIGFIRVNNPKNPLDNSAVHPENYDLVKTIAKDLNTNIENLIGNKELISKLNKTRYLKNVGVMTLNDIINELQKPSRDPRSAAEAFSFDENIKTIADVVPRMILPGIVTNVTNFGAFIDLGIKQNGLVHISNMS